MAEAPPTSPSAETVGGDKAYATKVAEGNFSFLRTNVVYKRSMEIAYKKWKWVEKRLR